jgi:DNA-binding transcriptional LysR family regulator
MTNSVRMLLDACVAGYVLAVMASFVERQHPTLRRVVPEEAPPPRHMWIAYHRDLQKFARVRAFVDFFVELCKRERALLLGKAHGARRR